MEEPIRQYTIIENSVKARVWTVLVVLDWGIGGSVSSILFLLILAQVVSTLLLSISVNVPM